MLLSVLGMAFVAASLIHLGWHKAGRRGLLLASRDMVAKCGCVSSMEYAVMVF